MQTGGASALTLPEITNRRAVAQANEAAYRFLGDGESESGHLTYGMLGERARAMAARIARVTKPGDRALLAYPAGLDFPVAFLACLNAGVIPAPVDAPRGKAGRDRLAAIARDCGASLLMTHSSIRAHLPDLGSPWILGDAWEDDAPQTCDRPAPAPDAIAYLQYTSGSTRAPRGVAISHRALTQQLDFYRARAGADLQDLVFVSWLPHTHDFGLVGFVLGALYLGRPLVAMPPAAFLRNPMRWLEAISTYRGSYCGGPNFGYELCVRAAAGRFARDIDLSCWRIASLGGDHIAPRTLARFADAFAPVGFQAAAWLPAYGLAEAVLCASGRRGAVVKGFDAAALREKVAAPANGDDAAVQLVSCGAPMRGQQLRIVDPASALPLPEGAVGEIWLAGESLAAGYWNDVDATRSQFCATLAGGDGARHLRTGDCGFMHRGELFVTGRLKDMLVVRGKNHAPDDIEQTAQSVDPALRAGCGAAVQAGPDGGGRLIVVQEVERSEGLDYPRLLAAIARAVAERHGLALDAIALIRAGSLPRTRNGKICRRACLAAFEEGRLRCVASWRRPTAEAARPGVQGLEASLIAELEAALQTGPIAREQNLFELGLDSLAIHGLLGRIERRFGIVVPLEVVFEASTVAALAAYLAAHDDAAPPPGGAAGAVSGDVSIAAALDELRELRALVAAQNELIRQLTPAAAAAAAPSGPAPKLSAAPDDATFPLNEAQREIALLPTLRQDAEAVFNILMALEHDGPLEAGTVRRALAQLTQRHESLRTVFDDRLQRILLAWEPMLEEVAVESEAELEAWLRAERRRSFSPELAPPWRASVVTLGRATFLVVSAHHLTLDGSSLPVLVREFVANCAQHEESPPPMQFRQFCAAVEARRNDDGRAARRRYWRDILGARLADFTPPGDGPRLQSVCYDAAVHSIILDAPLRGALARQGGAVNATLFHVLLGAYFALLHRVSGQERIVIGVDAANRAGAVEEGVVGCCNVLLPIVVDFDAPNEPLVARVRELVLEALSHRDYSMTMWAQDARIAPDLTRPFKITATMNMQRFPGRLGAFTPRFDLEAASVSQSPFGLALDVRDGEDGLRLDFVYNAQLFDAAQIARYGDYYRRLLAALAADATADLLAAPMLDEAEESRLLSLGRAAAAPAPYAPFLTRFAAQVALAPDAIAVACDDARLSYGALQARARAIARAIAQIAPPGAVVAVLGTRGCSFLASMIGVLQAGCIYLPLDPKDPDVRLAGQLAAAEAELLLHDCAQSDIAAGLRALAGDGLRTLDAERAAQTQDDGDTASDFAAARAEAPAYLIFTSGTSGVPKAAAISHGGMVNHLNAKIDALALTAADMLAQTAPQNFDISVWQYLAPLLVGGCVRVIPDRVTHDPRALFAETQRRAITVLEVVPSILRPAIDILLEPDMRCPLDRLRWLICTGEALPAGLCRRWISLYPDVPMMNAYGPTECSDDVAHHVVAWPPASDVVRAPIGRPIPGAELYVLDKRGRLAPTGAAGELYVGGVSVGLGYRNDPQRTQAAFVLGAFGGGPAARLYRTGDLVRFLDDGAIDYLGRLDQQVKIDGVRIEPREIEAAVQRDSAVLQCLVVARPGRDDKERLVAYVVFRPGLSSPEGALKAAARKILPPSLVPTHFVLLDAMPLTANGKIDLARLPEPDLRPRGFGAAPPSGAIETAVLEIWSAVIGAKTSFGVQDDFFELGGGSLDAAVIAKRIGTLFDIRVPVSAIFRAPTVAGLAVIIQSLLRPTLFSPHASSGAQAP